MSAVAMRAVGPLAVALLVSSVSVGVAVEPGTPASLEDCVKTALERSPTILSARAGRDLSAAGVTGALAPIVPHLSPLSAGYSRTYFGPQSRKIVFNGVEFPSDVPSYTGPPNVSLGISASTDALSLSQWKDLGRARSDLRASVYDVRDAHASIALSVVQAYYGLVGSERTRDVAIEAVGNARDRQRRARAFYEVGTVARGDVSKAVRDLAQAELDSITAENAVAVARARLASTMGLDPVTDVRVITDLPEPDTTELQSMTEINTVTRGEEGPPSSSTVDNRPDIRALRARAEAAHASTASAKASLWPAVSTSYSYRWNANKIPSSDAPLDKNYSWTLALDMSIPVFDWMTTHARVSQAAAAERQSQYRLQEQRQLATQELVQARLDLHEAAGRLRVAKVGLAAAEDDYAFSRERYGVGAGTSLELRDAQLGLSRAKVSYIDALVQARVAVASLARAEGRPVVPSHPETGGDAR